MQTYSANDPRQTIKNIWGFDPFSTTSEQATNKAAPKARQQQFASDCFKGLFKINPEDVREVWRNGKRVYSSDDRKASSTTASKNKGK